MSNVDIMMQKLEEMFARFGCTQKHEEGTYITTTSKPRQNDDEE